MKNPRNKLWHKLLLADLFAFPAICVGLMIWHLINYSGNHTGFEFLLVLIPLAVTTLLAVWLLCFQKINIPAVETTRYSDCAHNVRGPISAKTRGYWTLVRIKPAAMAVVTNIAAIMFFLVIDHYNIMVQYDRWLERGMPASIININRR